MLRVSSNNRSMSEFAEDGTTPETIEVEGESTTPETMVEDGEGVDRLKCGCASGVGERCSISSSKGPSEFAIPDTGDKELANGPWEGDLGRI